MTEYPKLTIIIVVKNDLANLKLTMESIPTGVSGLDLLVKDGGSEDGTLPWLKTLERTDLTYVSSEDRGIYDAMNQGVNASRGEYYWFVNAGERLIPGVVPEILAFLECKNPMVLKVLVQTEGGEVRRERASPAYFMKRMLNHQGLIYCRAAVKHQFDPSCFIVGDLKHLLEHNLWKQVAYLDRLAVIYLGGGMATSRRAILQNWKERATIWRWTKVSFSVRAWVFLGASLGVPFWYLRAVLSLFR